MSPEIRCSNSFWRIARDYLRAARSVKSAHGERLLFPLLYLYGLSIELALKAFLLRRGAPYSEVRDYSHGLAGLLSAARKRKLGSEVKLKRVHVAALRALHVTYSSNQLRYMVSGRTVAPNVSHLAEVAEPSL